MPPRKPTRDQVRQLLVVMLDCAKDPACFSSEEIDLEAEMEAELRLFDSHVKPSAEVLRYFVSNNLILWNESPEADTRVFWARVQERGLPFEREDPIKKLLARGAIRNSTEYELAVDELGDGSPRLSKADLRVLTKLVADFETKPRATKRARSK